MFRTILICFVLAGIAMPLPLSAQQPPSATQQTQNIKRTPLQKFDVPGTNYETVIGLAEIVPNVNIGRHTHPGPKIRLYAGRRFRSSSRGSGAVAREGRQILQGASWRRP